jgi:tetratricopeptide (TPR) repeat protein
MRTTIKLVAALALSSALAACGGANKGGGTTAGGGGGGDVPPPPPPGSGGDTEGPKVVVSADARSDFEKASAFFAETEKTNGWNQSTCGQSAESFKAVASEHKQLADAQYMVGLSYHRCNMAKQAEDAYQATLRANPNHAQSLSNLGEIYYRQGKVDGARQYWTRAVQAYQKLIAARNNLASLILDDMRKTTDDKKWAALDKEAQNHLSSVLAVDNDNVKAYTLYALVYMEGRKRNKNRLDLAKLLMDEGEKRKNDYAPLKNARGLLYLYRNNLGLALKSFQEAVALDPKFVEARMNVGLTTLNFRNYPAAKEQFEKVLELDAKNYDAAIGIGIVARGTGDLDGAEQAYNKAKGFDGARGEAFYNLGVLYKDFRATKENDLDKAKDLYRKAKGYFQDFVNKSGAADDKAEAKNNIEDCDKLVKQLTDFQEMQKKQEQMRKEFEKNNPPQPTPAPAPAGGAATPAPAGGGK